MRLTACPSCGGHGFAQHCVDSQTCDLVECTLCHAFGTVEGKRWAVRPGQKR